MPRALRLAAPPRVLAHLVPALVGAAGHDAPPAVIERDDAKLGEALRSGAVDVAVGEVAGEALDVLPVADDPLVLLMPAEWLLARAATAPPADRTVRLPLVGLERRSAVQRAVECWLTCASGGTVPRFRVRCESDVALPALVAAGLGVAICPALALTPVRRRGVVAFALPEPAPAPRAIVVATRSGEPVPDLVHAALRALTPPLAVGV